MQEIIKLATSYSAEISIGLIGATSLLILASLVNGARISSLKKKNRKLSEILKLSNGSVIEDSLISAMSFREKFEEDIDRLDGEVQSIKSGLSKSIQNVGFVRYNAFGDMGSDLSFSVALLDEKLNGVVITSIYGREDSNVYAKPVKTGISDYKLSVEEIQAIDRAKNSKLEVVQDMQETTSGKRAKNTAKTEETQENPQ
jgi:hypothetical protein